MAFKIPLDTPLAVPTQSGSFKIPINAPTPENALKARAQTGAESFLGGNDPTNPLAATISDDLTLHTGKPIYGAMNAASEWWKGNDPGAGYTAGTSAYDEAMKKRREAAGWPGTIGGTVAAGTTTGVLQGLGVPAPLTGAISGASQMSNDPGSAVTGGVLGAGTQYLGGKVAGWVGNKVANLFNPVREAPTMMPPGLLRRGSALLAEKTAQAIEGGGEKAVQGGGLPAAAYMAYQGHPYLAIASGLAAVGTPYAKRGLLSAAEALRQEAPGYAASVMNPRQQMAQAIATGALNSGAVTAPAQSFLQGGW